MNFKLFLFSFLTLQVKDNVSTQKVRYWKARKGDGFDHSRKSSPIDVIAFLGRFNEADSVSTDHQIYNELFSEYFYDDTDVITTPFTTPGPPSITTPRPSRPAKQVRDYCVGRRGQFGYDPDCHSYVDCWDGSAVLKKCFPSNLVFNPATRQCTWPTDPGVKNLCSSQSARREDITQAEEVQSRPCSDLAHLGYRCVHRSRCQDDSRRADQSKSKSPRSPIVAVEQSSMKSCPNQNEVCCHKGNIKLSVVRPEPVTGMKSTLCPSDFSGIVAYPYDCNKFTNCWKGKPTIQNCAPGTQFNSKLGQCDFPHKAKCKEMDPSQEVVQVPGSSEHHSELYEMSALARSAISEKISFPAPPSGQRVRLRGGGAPYSGYLELFHADSWGYVCDSSSWTMTEADIVCKQLGFRRGLRSTTQGLIHGSVDLSRKMTENVVCAGTEDNLEKCRIQYTSKSFSSCDLNKDIVSVTCVHDSLAVCDKGEVPWGTKCYSLHFNVASFSEAQSVCKAEGKILVEITSQQENDLISELLIASRLSPSVLKQVWTGGIAGLTSRAPFLFWDGSRSKIGLFRNWWPGWQGERRGDPLEMRNSNLGLKISRSFEFISQTQRERIERLTDYYFWMLEDFRTKLPFVCESSQKSVGCIEGNGESYRGEANRGESGEDCLKWDSPQLSFVLDEDKIGNLGNLTNNNFCRNPDGDVAPWCIAPNGEFDYCDIPKCDEPANESSNVIFDHPTVPSEKVRCPAGQFQCGPGGNCILAVYVCDGHQDCEGGYDESDCTQTTLQKFSKTGRYRLDVPHLERWLHTSTEGCAAHCLKSPGFTCKSFNYHAGKKLCTLSDTNVGLTGKLILDPQWDYYELNKFSIRCDPSLQCENGKCLTDRNLICDGKNDCGDNSDETKSCGSTPQIHFRLVGGRTSNEGRIEVKALNFDYGGICDDGFAIEEADVICRQLGFKLGAKQALTKSHFSFGSGRILIDELDCVGSETSLLDCKFDPWTVNDCSKEEWAGVVCKTEEEECKDEEWRCGSGECISLEFLCDKQRECVDGSDENPEVCRQPVIARLGDGNAYTSGRLEVRYKSVWGTVCDDNFGEAEAIVACRMLGFEGRAIVHSEAAYNPGKGPIWLHNVVCKGTESSLEECLTSGWAPTYQCKHLEDVGLECIPGKGNTTDIGTRFGPSTVEAECGVAKVVEIPNLPEARVASGMKSKPGSQPWAAAIRLQGSQKSFHWCGAVVVSEFFVLTAAHCMEDYPKDVYRVRIGDWDMQVSDLEEQEFTVEAVYFHENYNVGVYLNNDIAVIKIKATEDGRGIRFGDRVTPVCLPPASIVYDTHLNCTVAGWGSTGIAQPGYTRYLQSAQVPYLDTEQCMATQVYGPKKLSSGMFCAGFLEGGVDTCQGDSGGGLVCDVRDRKTLLGLTSWGYGCGRPNRPGVYTKISHYVEWIIEKISKI